MLGHSLKNLTSCLHMTSRLLFASWWSLFILVWYYDPIYDIRNETTYYHELHQLSSVGKPFLSVTFSYWRSSGSG